MSTDKVQKLLDIVEIQNLKAAYCDTVDFCGVPDLAKIAAGFKAICIPECTSDYGFVQHPNRDALAEFMIGVARDSELIWHGASGPRIEINGDTAVGEWTVSAYTRAKGSTEQSHTFGRYRDEFRRTPQGWRFTKIGFAMVQ